MAMRRILAAGGAENREQKRAFVRHLVSVLDDGVIAEFGNEQLVRMSGFVESAQAFHVRPEGTAALQVEALL